MSSTSVPVEDANALALEDNSTEFVEERPTFAARGAITGVLLGAGLWGMILVVAGVIKL
jgi:hypothetical protein